MITSEADWVGSSLAFMGFGFLWLFTPWDRHHAPQLHLETVLKELTLRSLQGDGSTFITNH